MMSAPANQRAAVMDKKMSTCCHFVARKVVIKEKDGVGTRRAHLKILHFSSSIKAGKKLE